MRSSICAQSCASVPPEPDWMSMKQLFGSRGSENMRRNSRSPTSFSSFAISSAIPERVASSFSARAISNRPRESRKAEAIAASRVTVASRDFFSLPRSCARFGSFQTLGSVRSVSTSVRRFSLPSKSKIPPQLHRPFVQVRERRGDLIDAFGFHSASLQNAHYRAGGSLPGYAGGPSDITAPFAYFTAQPRDEKSLRRVVLADQFLDVAVMKSDSDSARYVLSFRGVKYVGRGRSCQFIIRLFAQDGLQNTNEFRKWDIDWT